MNGSWSLYILQTQPNHQEVIKMLNNKLRQEEDMVDVIALIKEVGHEEGREKGAKEKAIATAKRMLAHQMDHQTIADITELSLEDVAKIERESKP